MARAGLRRLNLVGVARAAGAAWQHNIAMPVAPGMVKRMAVQIQPLSGDRFECYGI
jgi:hypothetical protein